MIFTLLLTVVFLFMAFYSVVFVRRASVRYLLLFVYIAAIFFVWHPDSTTYIANLFGIGRGLDFMLVLFSVGVINGALFIVKHLNAQHQSITRLARHMAIRDARRPHSSDKPSSLQQ